MSMFCLALWILWLVTRTFAGAAVAACPRWPGRVRVSGNLSEATASTLELRTHYKDMTEPSKFAHGEFGWNVTYGDWPLSEIQVGHGGLDFQHFALTGVELRDSRHEWLGVDVELWLTHERIDAVNFTNHASQRFHKGVLDRMKALLSTISEHSGAVADASERQYSKLQARSAELQEQSKEAKQQAAYTSKRIAKSQRLAKRRIRSLRQKLRLKLAQFEQNRTMALHDTQQALDALWKYEIKQALSAVKAARESVISRLNAPILMARGYLNNVSTEYKKELPTDFQDALDVMTSDSFVLHQPEDNSAALRDALRKDTAYQQAARSLEKMRRSNQSDSQAFRDLRELRMTLEAIALDKQTYVMEVVKFPGFVSSHTGMPSAIRHFKSNHAVHVEKLLRNIQDIQKTMLREVRRLHPMSIDKISVVIGLQGKHGSAAVPELLNLLLQFPRAGAEHHNGTIKIPDVWARIGHSAVVFATPPLSNALCTLQSELRFVANSPLKVSMEWVAKAASHGFIRASSEAEVLVLNATAIGLAQVLSKPFGRLYMTMSTDTRNSRKMTFGWQMLAMGTVVYGSAGACEMIFKRGHLGKAKGKGKLEEGSSFFLIGSALLLIHLLLLFGLPWSGLRNATCLDGYPYEQHFLYALFQSCLRLVEIFFYVMMGGSGLGLGWMLFKLTTGLLGGTDFYTDATFIAITYVCRGSLYVLGYDLWIVAAFTFLLGVVLLQLVVPGVLMIASKGQRNVLMMRLLNFDILAAYYNPHMTEGSGSSTYGNLAVTDKSGRGFEKTKAVLALGLTVIRALLEDSPQSLVQWEFKTAVVSSNFVMFSIMVSITVSFLGLIASIKEFCDYIDESMAAEGGDRRGLPEYLKPEVLLKGFGIGFGMMLSTIIIPLGLLGLAGRARLAHLADVCNCTNATAVNNSPCLGFCNVNVLENGSRVIDL